MWPQKGMTKLSVGNDMSVSKHKTLKKKIKIGVWWLKPRERFLKHWWEQKHQGRKNILGKINYVWITFKTIFYCYKTASQFSFLLANSISTRKHPWISVPHTEFHLLPCYSMANDTHIFPCEKYIYFGGCKKQISSGLFDFIKGQSWLTLNIWNRLIHSTTATVFSLKRDTEKMSLFWIGGKPLTTEQIRCLQRKATWGLGVNNFLFFCALSGSLVVWPLRS